MHPVLVVPLPPLGGLPLVKGRELAVPASAQGLARQKRGAVEPENHALHEALHGGDGVVDPRRGLAEPSLDVQQEFVSEIGRRVVLGGEKGEEGRARA